jgi:hypothetical protein
MNTVILLVRINSCLQHFTPKPRRGVKAVLESSLHGCDASSFIMYFPTFRRNVVPSWFSLVWDLTQRMLVVVDRHSGTACWSPVRGRAVKEEYCPPDNTASHSATPHCQFMTSGYCLCFAVPVMLKYCFSCCGHRFVVCLKARLGVRTSVSKPATLSSRNSSTMSA